MSKSLAAKVNAVATVAPNLPPALVGGFETFVSKYNTPYVSFAQPAAKEQWQQLIRSLPNVEDGDPVLFMPNGTLVPLKPMQFIVCQYKQYFATVDAAGNELERYSTDGGGMKERVWSALLVFTPTGIVPATCMFKTTKCPAITGVISEVMASTQPDWIKRGPAYEQAVAACTLPNFRVIGEVRIIAKPGRGKGLPYKLAQVTPRPTTAVEWEQLSKLNSDTVFLNDVAAGYAGRLAELNIKTLTAM
jgi:hypothetical protein